MKEQQIVNDIASTISSEYVGDGEVSFQISSTDASRITWCIYEDLTRLKALVEVEQ